MSKITGSNQVFEQPSRYGRTEAGQFATVPYESTNKDALNALALDADRQGLSYQVDHSFGKSRLEINYSFNPQAIEQAVDLWEYNGRSTPKDLLQAVVNTGITGKLSQKNIELLRRCLNNDFSTTADHLTLVATDFADGSPANSMTLYALMKSGFTDYPVVAPGLRHTQSVSQIYPITLSQLNVGKIISTSTMFGLELTLPSWAAGGLPTIAPPSFADGKAFVFAWFKESPVINQIAGQKVQIVQEFQYGLWPTAVFGAAL